MGSGSIPTGVHVDLASARESSPGNRTSQSLTMPSDEPPEAKTPGIVCMASRLVTLRKAVLLEVLLFPDSPCACLMIMTGSMLHPVGALKPLIPSE